MLDRAFTALINEDEDEESTLTLRTLQQGKSLNDRSKTASVTPQAKCFIVSSCKSVTFPNQRNLAKYRD